MKIYKYAAIASLVAGSQVAFATTVNLTDGTRSISCVVNGALSMQNDVVTGSVPANCFDALSGGGGGVVTYALSVTGAAGGIVTSNPVGINCGSSCSYSFPENQSVTLTATPSSGYTFAGWSGVCSGSSTSCTTTMDAAKSATAAFNASSGGGGSTDPGTGVWNPTANHYVFDRGGSIDIYVPRCVPSAYSNCRYGGSQSQYDSINAGEIWSMRVPQNVTKTTRYRIEAARSETGESLTAFDVSFSTVPGDFDSVSPSCKKINGGVSSRITIVPQAYENANDCGVTPGVEYYFNIRPAIGTAGATECGSSASKKCRVKVFWNIPMN